MSEDLECLTVNQLADKLKIHPKTLRAWVAQGKVPVLKMPGKGIRFQTGKIKSWMEIRTIKQKPLGANVKSK